MIEAVGFFFLGVALTPITGYLQKKLTMIVKTGKLNTESFIYKFFEKYPDLQKVIKEIIGNVEEKLGSKTGEAKMQSAIVFLTPFLPKWAKPFAKPLIQAVFDGLKSKNEI